MYCIMFFVMRTWRNAFVIYFSWLSRKSPKPPCKVFEVHDLQPELFEDIRACPDCSCKYACRYDGKKNGPKRIPAYIFVENR